MNRKQKIVVSITGIFLVLMILVGLTYAYFLTKITGNTNDKSISVTTANLQVKYEDNSAEILGENLLLEPSDNEIGSKTFTVTNEGNAKTNYGVSIENVTITKSSDGTTTTFESNDFRYTLTCTKKDGNICNQIDEQKTFPIDGGIVVLNDIDVNDVHTYTLKMWYIDTGIDQSKDMGKTLQAKLNIVDIRTNADKINPYSANKQALNYHIINNALQNITDTTYRDKPLTNINDTMGAMYEIADENDLDEVLTSSLYVGINSFKVSDSKEKASSGENITSFEEAVGKWVFSGPDGILSKLVKYDSTNSKLYFAKNVFVAEKTLANTQDDYGTSYYYRGDVNDNYVNFINMCWRIVRIDGNGNIKIILEDKSHTCNSSSYSGEWSIGTSPFGYDTGGKMGYASYNYLTPSAVAEGDAMYYYFLDFQNQYLSDKTDKLANDWCIGNDDMDTFTSLKCNSDIITTFASGKEMYVGTLNAKEMVYAGSKYLMNPYEPSLYLLNSNKKEWLSFSVKVAGSNSDDQVYYFDSYGNVNITPVSTSKNLRPAISLKSNIKITGGNGTKTNPYVVE